VAAELAEIDASLTDQIDAADAVGTPAELAEFTGIPETELHALGRRRTGEPRPGEQRGANGRGQVDDPHGAVPSRRCRPAADGHRHAHGCRRRA